jgi:hypothetical protein
MNEVLNFCRRHRACAEALAWIAAENVQTLAEAWEKCPRASWMLWGLSRRGGGLAKEQAVRTAIAFAARALPVWAKRYPHDPRPQQALAAAQRWLDDSSAEEAADAAIYDAAAFAFTAAASADASAADAFDAAAAFAAADAAFAAVASTDAASADAAADAADAAADTDWESLWQADYLRQTFHPVFE